MILLYFCFSNASEPHPGQNCILGKVSSGGLTEWRKGSARALAHLTTHASVLAVLPCNNGSWCTVIEFHASKGNISSVSLCVSVYLSVFRLDFPFSCLSPCKLAQAGLACLPLFCLHAWNFAVCASQTTTLGYPFQKSVYSWIYLWNGLTHVFDLSSYLSHVHAYFQDQIHISLRRCVALKALLIWSINKNILKQLAFISLQSIFQVWVSVYAGYARGVC